MIVPPLQPEPPALRASRSSHARLKVRTSSRDTPGIQLPLLQGATAHHDTSNHAPLTLGVLIVLPSGANSNTIKAGSPTNEARRVQGVEAPTPDPRRPRVRGRDDLPPTYGAYTSEPWNSYHLSDLRSPISNYGGL